MVQQALEPWSPPCQKCPFPQISLPRTSVLAPGPMIKAIPLSSLTLPSSSHPIPSLPSSKPTLCLWLAMRKAKPEEILKVLSHELVQETPIRVFKGLNPREPFCTHKDVWTWLAIPCPTLGSQFWGLQGTAMPASFSPPFLPLTPMSWLLPHLLSWLPPIPSSHSPRQVFKAPGLPSLQWVLMGH